MLAFRGWIALLTVGLLAARACPATAGEFDQGLLWKVEVPGAAPSYVFGTMHSDAPRIVAVPGPVTEAFASATTYVMEMVPDTAAVGSLLKAMTFAGDRTLEQVLGPELYRRTAAALAAHADQAQKLRPWAALLTLSMPPTETGLVLDLKLYLQAVADSKAVVGLETVPEQVSIFADLPLTEQISLLRDTLDNAVLLRDVEAKLVEVYLARDLAGMVALNEQTMATGDPEFSSKLVKRLISDRNRRMARRMDRYLRQGNAFVAVGALHLPGDDGILTLLARRGYRVSRVY